MTLTTKGIKRFNDFCPTTEAVAITVHISTNLVTAEGKTKRLPALPLEY